jgi:hypothetical protein
VWEVRLKRFTYFQPECKDRDVNPVFAEGSELYSFMVFLDRANARRHFPDRTISEYHNGDIQVPTIIDAEPDEILSSPGFVEFVAAEISAGRGQDMYELFQANHIDPATLFAVVRDQA